MANFCIVTDNSAEFFDSKFHLLEELTLTNHHLSFGGKKCKFPAFGKKEIDLPLTVGSLASPNVTSPEPSEFSDLFTNLLMKNRNIIYVSMASGLSSANENAIIASKKNDHLGNIHIYDSCSISLGLGYIASDALKSVSVGSDFNQIDLCIRNVINRRYLDYSQSLSSEMLGLISIYSLEDGRLNPLEKVKSYPLLIDFFLEYLAEFDSLEMIGFVQSINSPEKKPLSTFIHENFPDAKFKQEKLSAIMSTLLGPRGIGLFIVEKGYAAEKQ